MANQKVDKSFPEFVTQLIDAGLDGRTVDVIVSIMAREPWQTARAAAITQPTEESLTSIGFAARLDEHSDRAHGVNVAMIGLRELLGEHSGVDGVHQLTIDLSDHAQALRRTYQALLAGEEIN